MKSSLPDAKSMVFEAFLDFADCPSLFFIELAVDWPRPLKPAQTHANSMKNKLGLSANREMLQKQCFLHPGDLISYLRPEV